MGDDSRVTDGRSRSFGVPAWSIAAGVPALVAIAFALRIGFLGDSLYGDEVGAFFDVSGHGLSHTIWLLEGHSPELNPPGFFVVTWLSEWIFGTSVQAMRVVPLVCGLLLIPLVYGLGAQMVNARVGLLAAALAVFCPFLIWYGIEARPYGLCVFLTLASTLSLLRAIETRRRRWWVLYAVISAGAAYTHFTAVFLLALQFVWCLTYHRDTVRALLGANVGAAILFAPWLPDLIRTSHSPGTQLYGLLEPLTAHAIKTDLPTLWAGGPYASLSQLPGRAIGGVILAGLAVALVGALTRAGATDLGARLRHRPAAEPALIGLLAFGVPLLIALYSAVRPSVWNPRDLITSLPAMTVLVAALVSSPKAPWSVLAGTLVLGGLIAAAITLQQRRFHRPDYAGVVAFIEHRSSGGEPVVDWPDLSPGPPNELEVAMRLGGILTRHSVLRLGSPTLPVVYRHAPYAALGSQTGQQVAREAVALAGRRGRMFLVVPGPIAVSELNRLRPEHLSSTPSSNILQLLAAFMGALPARWQFTSMGIFSGLHRPAVYELVDAGG